MKELLKLAAGLLVVLAMACGYGTGRREATFTENEKRQERKSPTGLYSITSRLKNGMSERQVITILSRSPDKTYSEREGQKEYRSCKWLVYPCITPKGRPDLKYGVIFCQFVRGKDGEWILDYYGPSWQRTAKL